MEQVCHHTRLPKFTSLSANVGFGTKALVDLDSVHVVTYGAFFGLIIFCDISGVFAISSEKVFFIGFFL